MQKPLKILVLMAMFATDALAWESDVPWVFERKILGDNNLTPIESVAGTDAYQFALVVARVERKGDASPFCTASRVGKNLFLTNFHCDYDCETMQFTMGVEAGKEEKERVTYGCTQLVHKTEEFDYALYQVEPIGEASEMEYPILTLSAGELQLNQPLVVASHPSGRMKEIDTSDECFISQVETFQTESGRTTIKHMCDTEGGSSGSPVLDRQTGYAVALHWGGRADQFNMAIPMNLIIKSLKENVPEEIFSELTIDGEAQ